MKWKITNVYGQIVATGKTKKEVTKNHDDWVKKEENGVPFGECGCTIEKV